MEISSTDFAYICKFLREHSAIHLEAGKEYLVETRFLPLIRELGHDDLKSFINWLRQNPTGVIHQRAVEALTTNETLFFRDFHPFETLRQHLLPKVVELNQTSKCLNIWSAACSTGQEPYTIEMILQDHFPQLSHWKTKILATDLAQQILERAMEGRYSQLEINRGLPAPMLIKHFVRDGEWWKVKPALRERLEFRPLNLIGSWLGVAKMDIIFLRNVLIYFQPEVKKQILEKMYHQLNPGGYLFLGGSETLLGLSDRFKTHIFNATVVYQRG